MKSIAILTATRAEYGLLKPVIESLINTKKYDVRVLVTGAHLSKIHGMTVNQIVDDGIPIDVKVDILQNSDTPMDISICMARAISGFAEYFNNKRPDALLVLGDRYEILGVCIAAMNEHIPIIHLYGGDTTEGAIDECVRHSVTKMSCLHLVSTKEAQKRVIQLGENPDTVHNVGSLGVENALNQPLMTREELSESLGFSLDKGFAVVTFHPVTLEAGEARTQCQELIKALESFPELKYIITKANADSEGLIINELLENFSKGNENAILVDSLGMRRYLSAISMSEMVIGNSSSGLVEVPSFHVPTVNIGNRQKGRLRPESVIDCSNNADDIIAAMKLAQSESFKEHCMNCVNPYGNGRTTEEIVRYIDVMLSNKIDLRKKFYDIDYEIE